MWAELHRLLRWFTVFINDLVLIDEGAACDRPFRKRIRITLAISVSQSFNHCSLAQGIKSRRPQKKNAQHVLRVEDTVARLIRQEVIKQLVQVRVPLQVPLLAVLCELLLGLVEREVVTADGLNYALVSAEVSLSAVIFSWKASVMLEGLFQGLAAAVLNAKLDSIESCFEIYLVCSLEQ